MTRIGIIGAGSIVRSAHLPAYQAAGLDVVAIADPDSSAVDAAVQEFGIPQRFSSATELLSRADVDVVDIAVPPAEQPRIATVALAHGMHLLCQKPLAWTLEEAVSLVRNAEQAERYLAVNQQFRWSPLIGHVRKLLNTGELRQPSLATLDITTSSDWTAWPWLVDQPRLDLIAHSIHYLDAFRYLFGEPRLVTTLGRRSVNQREGGESITVTTLDFGDVLAVLTVNHSVPFPALARGELRLTGKAGALEGQIGLYRGLNFVTDEPDSVAWFSSGAEHATRELEGRWFPDAFAEPMRSLIHSIESGDEPATSGADNLKTLAVVFAGYRSMELGRPVSPDAILSEAIDRVDAATGAG